MKNEIPTFLLMRQDLSGKTRPGKKKPLLDKGMSHFSGIIKTTYVQWDLANKEGFMQRLDARIKLIFLPFFIIVISMKGHILPEVLIMIFIFSLAAASRVNLLDFYGRVVFLGVVFGLSVALPSSLNIITNGEVVMPLLRFTGPHALWIYHIPATVGVTREGIAVVGMLTLRVINSLSLSFLIINTTPFMDMMKALQSLRVPSAFLMIVTLCYKYIFIFANILEEMHLSKKSRTVAVDGAHARRWISGRIAFLLRKMQARSEDVFKAILGRGFCGDIVFCGLRAVKRRDLASGFFLFGIGMLLLML